MNNSVVTPTAIFFIILFLGIIALLADHAGIFGVSRDVTWGRVLSIFLLALGAALFFVG